MVADAPFVVRFHPTPVATCSVGLARAAFVTAVLAEGVGATTVITSDDLIAADGDLTAEGGVMAPLTWLGLRWDRAPWDPRPAGQELAVSRRLDRYHDAAETLLRLGDAYRCACEPREQPGQGRCRCARRTVVGPAAVRFRMGEQTTARIVDMATAVEGTACPAGFDPVLVRADGRPTAWLTTAVDDRDLGVTHRVADRGRDRSDALAIISARLGHAPQVVAEVGRVRFTGGGAPPDLASLAALGTDPQVVRGALLASLFGTWPASVGTDPVTAGAWADWRRLRRSTTGLDRNAVQASPPRRPPVTADAGPVAPRSATFDGEALLERRIALLRRRAGALAAGETGARRRPDEVVAGLRTTDELAFRPHLTLDEVAAVANPATALPSDPAPDPFSVVRAALDPTVIDHLRRVAATTPPGRTGRSSTRTLLPEAVGRTVTTGVVPIRLAADRLLGRGWSCSDAVLVTVEPGMPADDWHVDHPYYDDPDLVHGPVALAAQVIVPLCVTSEANGATQARLADGEGGHRVTTLAAEVGDIVFVDARVEHRSAANTTDEPRPAIVVNLVRRGEARFRHPQPTGPT